MNYNFVRTLPSNIKKKNPTGVLFFPHPVVTTPIQKQRKWLKAAEEGKGAPGAAGNRSIQRKLRDCTLTWAKRTDTKVQ